MSGGECGGERCRWDCVWGGVASQGVERTCTIVICDATSTAAAWPAVRGSGYAKSAAKSALARATRKSKSASL